MPRNIFSHMHKHENCWLINLKQLIRLNKTLLFYPIFLPYKFTYIQVLVQTLIVVTSKAEACWPQTTQLSRQLLTLFTQEGIVTAELLRPSEAKQKYRHLYEATKVIPKTLQYINKYQPSLIAKGLPKLSKILALIKTSNSSHAKNIKITFHFNDLIDLHPCMHISFLVQKLICYESTFPLMVKKLFKHHGKEILHQKQTTR